MVGPFDAHPGVDVQLDLTDESAGSLWVRWRPSKTLSEAALERFRQERRRHLQLFPEGGGDPLLVVKDPVVSFDIDVQSMMGEALWRILASAGFVASFGSNEYSPFDVRVTDRTRRDTASLEANGLAVAPSAESPCLLRVSRCRSWAQPPNPCRHHAPSKPDDFGDAAPARSAT